MAVIGVALAAVGTLVYLVTWLSVRGREQDALIAAIRLCERDQPHEDAAPYQGAGPHPAVVVGGGVRSQVVGTTAAPDPPAAVVQLVACGRRVDRPGDGPILSCPYGVIGATSPVVTEKHYRGHYSYEVRELRTGRTVGTFSIDGADASCDSGRVINVPYDGPAVVTLVTDPDAGALVRMLRRYVDDPAG